MVIKTSSQWLSIFPGLVSVSSQNGAGANILRKFIPTEVKQFPFNEKTLAVKNFLLKYQAYIKSNCTFGLKKVCMTEVYFSLGSNQGDRLNSLVKATELIDNLIGKVKQYSPVVESEPWGFNTETTFYNMVLVVETEYSPHQVLTKILDIEKSLGRIRHGKTYTNRIIDIDILFYGDKQINDDKLIIPHPLLQERKFVLQPLVAIAPNLIHPVFHSSMAELLLQLGDACLIPVVVDQEEFARLLNLINAN